MKVKQDSLHVYWRKKREGVYARDKPGLQVRQVTDVYLTKKQALSENQQGEAGEMLESLMDNIKAILTKDDVAVLEAKRRAR